MNRYPRVAAYAWLWDWLKFDGAWWAPLATLVPVAASYLIWAPYRSYRGIAAELAEVKGTPLVIEAGQAPRHKNVTYIRLRVRNRGVRTVDNLRLQIREIEMPATRGYLFLPLEQGPDYGINPGSEYETTVLIAKELENGSLVVGFEFPNAPREDFILNPGIEYRIMFRATARDVGAADCTMYLTCDGTSVQLVNSDTLESLYKANAAGWLRRVFVRLRYGKPLAIKKGPPPSLASQ